MKHFLAFAVTFFTATQFIYAQQDTKSVFEDDSEFAKIEEFQENYAQSQKYKEEYGQASARLTRTEAAIAKKKNDSLAALKKYFTQKKEIARLSQVETVFIMQIGKAENAGQESAVLIEKRVQAQRRREDIQRILLGDTRKELINAAKKEYSDDPLILKLANDYSGPTEELADAVINKISPPTDAKIIGEKITEDLAKNLSEKPKEMRALFAYGYGRNATGEREKKIITVDLTPQSSEEIAKSIMATAESLNNLRFITIGMEREQPEVQQQMTYDLFNGIKLENGHLIDLLNPEKK